MCTAITYKTNDSYFGRNLDIEYSYNESVTITPRKYKFQFRKTDSISDHFAIIGVSYVKNGYPLYYDALNEKGLACAGLNFPDNAHYFLPECGKINLASFELIPFILSQCANIGDVCRIARDINIINTDFSDELHATPLHWIFSDTELSVVFESSKEGLKVKSNPFGVLTNNPPFELQTFNLNNYMQLSPEDPVKKFYTGLNIYSRGMGAIGMPGDWSSQSRFVKAFFTKLHSESNNDESSSVSQFFHILSSVEMPCGCVKANRKNEFTVYSSCCNQNKGIYYYKTYNNSRISAVVMHNENLDGNDLINYPMKNHQDFFFNN